MGQAPEVSPFNIQPHPVIRKTKVWGKGRRKVISFIVIAVQPGESKAEGVRKNAFIWEAEGRSCF